MKNISFYKCLTCGNIIEVVDGDINNITCCSKPMEKLIANSVDASLEKHIPQYVVEEDLVSVTVGSTLHPMLGKS